jgi:hypothetical protein
LTDCDGSAVATIENTSCDVQVSILTAAPFSLPWGGSVYSKVIATNVYGDSAISIAGNGAIIITYADAPTNFAEIVAFRTSTSISFSWDEGASNGGNSVFDYRVSYDNSENVWAYLESEVTSS